jgi:hypothetical protein
MFFGAVSLLLQFALTPGWICALASGIEQWQICTSQMLVASLCHLPEGMFDIE